MTDWKSKWRTAYSGKWKQPYWYNEENIRTWYNPNDFKSEKEFFKMIKEDKQRAAAQQAAEQ